MVIGRHLAACTCADDGHEHVKPHHDHGPDEPCQDDTCRWCDDCTGCQPRLARVGRLCQPDIGRLTRALIDMPLLVVWVRMNVQPGTRSARGDVLREAPAPLDVHAVDDADRLHGLASTWLARYFAESGIGSAKTVAWLHEGAILRAGSNGLGAGNVSMMVLDHLAGVASQPWAGAWHDSIVTAHRSVSARWPREDWAIKLPLPCPSCDRVMLYMHPPATEGADRLVICGTDWCNRVLTSDSYYLLAHQALAERGGRRAVVAR